MRVAILALLLLVLIPEKGHSMSNFWFVKNTKILAKSVDKQTSTKNIKKITNVPSLDQIASVNTQNLVSSGLDSGNDLLNDNSVFSYKINTSSAGSSVQSQQVALVPSLIFQQGLFYGFASMLLLLNLVCFFLFSEKTFLYFSVLLTALSVLLFFEEGLPSLLFTEDATSTYGMTLRLSLLAVFTGIVGVFSEIYLSLKEHFKTIKYVGGTLFVIASISFLFYSFTQNIAFAEIASIFFFGVLLTYFFTGVLLFARKNYAKFYVIASFVPLLFGIDFFVLSPMGVEFLGAGLGHLKAALIAQMIILTYAIFYRMQSIKEENELRQIEMRIFLKRQEVLTARQKTEKLVEDVYLENLIMHYDLDGMEIKLLQYISEGKQNAKIARKLKVTESEVEELTKDLYQKLEISEQIQQDYRMVEQQPDYIHN